MGFLAKELKNFTFLQTALDVFLPKISYKNTQILSKIVNKYLAIFVKNHIW